jgi:ATP-dependent DNA helicase RecQ
VGRAGRSVPRAEAWLLPGPEDQRIWAWFASVGLPPEPLVQRVLEAVSADPGAPSSLPALEAAVDLRRARLETLLKILDVDGVVERVPGGVVRTGRQWTYDRERAARIQAARDAEAAAMVAYQTTGQCLMEFLRSALDDPDAGPCGRCTNCTATPPPLSVDPALVTAAVQHLRGVDVVLEPRRAWPRSLAAPKGNIRPATRAEEGRALCRVGDSGWWPAVEAVLAGGDDRRNDHGWDDDGSDDHGWDEVVPGVAEALRRWEWAGRPTWVAWVPSVSSALPERLARRIGELGKLPVHGAVARTRAGRPQAELANSTHRCSNVWPAFAVDPGALPGGSIPPGPVLVVDDTYDSGWTLTVVAHRLREAGADAVLPFVLAKA